MVSEDISGTRNGSHIKQIKKRDGRFVPFEIGRIERAVRNAMQVTGEGNIDADPPKIASNVQSDLEKYAHQKGLNGNFTPEIELIQNFVERELVRANFPTTVREYITYRDERSRIRSVQVSIPQNVRELMKEQKKFFRNELSEFVYMTKYSRWNEKEGRREIWPETIQRYTDFMQKNLGSRLSEHDKERVHNAILQQQVMPSMRLLWSAGKAAEGTNVAAYNCAYSAPTKLKDFGDLMYILMCGAGAGFSVEARTNQHLPIVQKQNHEKLPTYVISDSKEGWAQSFIHGLETWYAGRDVDFDYSKIRPAGSKLQTMGGRSSGPEVLRSLLDYSRQKILNSQGRRLESLAIHDILCKTGEVVVAGGVRRSALISLSDLDDIKMRDAKSGTWYMNELQRNMANNSAVYNDKPSQKDFLEEWLSLIKSNSGERGIFNRGSLRNQLPTRRLPWFEQHLDDSGMNPCGEIYLPSKGFCNLTEVVARPNSTLDDLLGQIEIAAMMGTYQATLTNFPFISSEWKEHAEQERLLGVSITGMMDCPLLRNPAVLRRLKEHAIEVNRHYSKMWGINEAAAVTCVKPSGNVSQLVDSSSGIHGREAQYYLRRARINSSDPIFQMLKEQKYPYDPEVGQNAYSATTFVLPFAIETPKSTVLKKDLSAIQQLEEWKKVKMNYTEHNPSVTVTVGDNEWIQVADWVYGNWDNVGGLSFLPKTDHIYALAPYEEVSAQRFHDLSSRLPKIDYSQLIRYEREDFTSGAREAACVGGACQLG